MMRVFPALLGLLGLVRTPGVDGYQSLHLVDLQKVICPGEQGYIDIDLDSTQLSGDAQTTPHIVTFLRSSNLETSVTFQLLQTDGSGQVATTGVGTTVALTYLAQERRLSDEAVGRQLSARRRGSYSSPRRRPSPAPKTSSSTASSPRRRSSNPNSAAARRRGTSTMDSGARRRAAATTAPNSPATHNRFQTQGGSGYGYSNQQQMQSGYGGKYPQQSPPYGYSGASSYGPSRPGGSSTGTIVAAAAGGAIVGAGLVFAALALALQGYECCQGCGNQNSCYSQQTSCNQQMDRQLYRDDIMQDGTGFYPSDYMAPLKIRISSVVGKGYEVDTICPPPGWNGDVSTSSDDNSSSTTATPPEPPNDLFVTLTAMMELADSGDSSAVVSSAMTRAALAWLVTAACPLVLLLSPALP
eukprot:CAMPEP_0115052242 /NCGR_PEP_ID=MMETSP0227-20121206/2816_1 /TAXON_ID=89957 /ORGANISM="Polarella glacialis, Strain CCMP 1383" /LENGTH=412 /DNA_ID=CAMNT_0002436357 /DNA_START=62 /DNA_END=1301 /DNA_ORIENTATION=-